MCGLMGYVGQTREGQWGQTHKILNALFIESQKRGKDATGFVALTDPLKRHGQQSVILDKLPLPAEQFMVQSRKWRSLWLHRSSIVLGHTRLATHGHPAENKNNHPFTSQDGNLHLCHNGCLLNHDTLTVKHNVRLFSDCDSEVLLRIVERHHNPAAGLKECLSQVMGSVAVSVLDSSRGVAYLARNNGNPIWLCKLKDKRWFFASTGEILYAALKSALGQEDCARQMQLFFSLGQNVVHLLSPAGLFLATG